jgi:L-fuconolactonase
VTMPELVDAHVHFWDPGRLSYPWLDAATAIARAHGPVDLALEAAGTMPDAIVFVQAECDRARGFDEVAWVQELAAEEPRIQGIVAFAPMNEGDATRAAIARLSRVPAVRGVRHLIQDDPDVDLCRRPAFIEGVRRLGDAGLAFDLCLRAAQLPAVVDLVRACPGTRFVLDHAAKPGIGGGLDPWRAGIEALAASPRVACKLSGLVTEAAPGARDVATLRPYVEHLVACFGPERLLFGSDWPVVKLASSYVEWLATARALVDHLAPAAKREIFSGTARRTYGLPWT